MAGVPTNVAQLMAVLSLNTAPFKAEAAAATTMMGATGPIAMAALGMGAVVAGVGVVATKMAGDFQSGLTSLVTGAGESQQNIKLVSAGILQMAKDTGTSTQQLISGMYMIESGGFHGAAGLKILQAAAEGAKVGSADLGTIADSVDTILKNFGEGGALTATQATNALITTVANGKTHLEDLANSLSFVLPAGAAAGLGLKDVLGAMATLTSVGVPAAESATYLRQMIIALEAPSSGAKKALAGIGISAEQLGAAMKRGLPDALQLIQDKLKEHGITQGTAAYVAALREISGGTRQMQGMLNLMGPHLATFKEDVGKIGGAASSTAANVNGWALVQKTMNQQFDRAKEVAETLMIQLGQNLLPVMTHLFGFLADTGLPALKNMVQWLTGTGNQFTWLRPILAGVAIVIGGALVASFIAWAASAAAAAIATIAATWPILLIGAAIAGLVALIIYAYNNWGWFKTAVDGAKQSIGIFLGVLGVLIHAVGPAFQFAIAGMRYTIGLFFAAIGQLAGTIGNAVGGVLGWFGRLGEGILQTLGSLPQKLLALGRDLIRHLADGIRSAAGDVAAAVANVPLIGGMAGKLTQMIPHFALGGVMPAAGVALVGERGPELVQLPAGARITPAAQVPTGMRNGDFGTGGGSGQGSGQPIIVQLHLDGRRVAEVVLPYLTPHLRNALGNRKF